MLYKVYLSLTNFCKLTSGRTYIGYEDPSDDSKIILVLKVGKILRVSKCYLIDSGVTVKY